VAFLRAVNVGKRTTPNAKLIEIFRGLGYENVWTFINSGNVIFDATGSRGDLEHRIGAALEEAFGFEVTTFVRTAAELRKVVALEPFTMADGDTYLVTFLQDAPSAAITKSFEAASNDFDTLVVHGREAHWHLRGKSTDTTLKKATWKLVGPFSTSRNITMLRKLVGKLDG